MTDKEFHALLLPAIIMAGFVVYANSFSNEFVWDDASSVLLHQHVQDPSKIAQLFREDQHAFGRGVGAFYRPLVSVSFMVDYLVTTAIAPVDDRPPGQPLQEALSPFLFHLTNTAWHILAALLLYGILVRFDAPRALRAVVPLVWVVHPLHTEAVTYISGRADSMAAAFVFAALLFATSTRMKPFVAIALSLVCFTGAILSKESGMIYPALLFFAILCKPDSEKKSSVVARWIPLAGALIVLAGYAVLKTTLLNFPSDSTPPDTGLGQRIIEMFQALSLYIAMTFAPLALHMERSLVGVSAIVALPGLVALIAMTGTAIWAWRNDRKRITFAFTWFTVTWLPISGIFPLNAPMAEHWLYVPLAGLLWGLGELILPFLKPRPVVVASTLAVAIWTVVLVGISVDRNRDWRSNESIFRATLQRNPDSLRVRYNLGVTYEDLTKNEIGAIREFNRFLQAVTDLRSAQPDRAEPYTQTAMEAGISLGGLYYARGRLQEAAQQFTAVVDFAAEESPEGRRLPADLPPETSTLVAEASIGLGQCFQAIGNQQAAGTHFDRAVQLRPDLAATIGQIRGGGAAPVQPR